MKKTSILTIFLGFFFTVTTSCSIFPFESMSTEMSSSSSSSASENNVTLYTEADRGSVTGEGHYEVGDTVTLTAFPKDGYQFYTWYDGANVNDWFAVENPYVFTFSEPVWIAANYQPVEEPGVRDRFRNLLEHTLQVSEQMTLNGPIYGHAISGLINTENGFVKDFSYHKTTPGREIEEDDGSTYGFYGNIYQSFENNPRKIFYPDPRPGLRTLHDFLPDYFRPSFLFDMDMRFSYVTQDTIYPNRMYIEVLISDGVVHKNLNYDIYTENDLIVSIMIRQNEYGDYFNVCFNNPAITGLSFGKPEPSEFARAYRVILRLPDGLTRDYGNTRWDSMPVLDPEVAGFSEGVVQGFYLDEAHEIPASSIEGNVLSDDVTIDVDLTSTTPFAMSAFLADPSWGIFSVSNTSFFAGEIVTLKVTGLTYRPTEFSSFVTYLTEDEGLSVLSSSLPSCIDPAYHYAVSFSMPDHAVNITL